MDDRAGGMGLIAVLTGSPLRLEREMQVDDDAGHTLLRIMFREVVDFSEGRTGS